ncbi:MAG: cyclopropane-fatty-acyl-phospholipid synthase family protein [Verrucomicrobiota bacterium]
MLNRPSALREMLLAGSETGVGEAYLNAAFDVEGSIEAAFELADWIMDRTGGWTRKLDLGRLIYRLPEGGPKAPRADRRAQLRGHRHSLDRDRKAIDFHYNVSNEFYAFWLGEEMAYSCAYFESPEDDLDTAQRRKFDHICRKLGLRPGHRFLDIGCGWGGLVLHAAKHYGVQAEGITLSEEQLKLARRRIADAALEDRVTVRLQDYRELPPDPQFDAVASVGMVEHVGRRNLPTYFQKIHSLLKTGGLFLNHGIGLGPVSLPGNSGSFIQDYVFPDTDLLPIGEMTRYGEQEGWEVRDVENLRRHYARTLREWLWRLESRREDARRCVGERLYRVWRLYMAGCAHNFETGRLAIYQSLLAKIDAEGHSRAPEIRRGWYQENGEHHAAAASA